MLGRASNEQRGRRERRRARRADRRVGGGHAARRRRCRRQPRESGVLHPAAEQAAAVPRESHEVVRYFTLDAGTGASDLGQPTSTHGGRSLPFRADARRGRSTRRFNADRRRHVAGGRRPPDSVFTDARGRQRGRAIAEQRRAGVSARSAREARRGNGARALRRRHDRLRRHDVVRGDPLDESGVHRARCATRCRTCASRRRRSARTRCVSSSSSRSRSASRRRSASGSKTVARHHSRRLPFRAPSRACRRSR